MTSTLTDFQLPPYREIPDVGLYLEQVARFIEDAVRPLPGAALTTSMISNYVKKDIVPNPVKKLYNRELIASLLFIAVAKSVLSLEDIQMLLTLRAANHEAEVSYEEFRTRLTEAFGAAAKGGVLAASPADAPVERRLLHATLAAVAHKAQLDAQFAALRETEPAEE